MGFARRALRQLGRARDRGKSRGLRQSTVGEILRSHMKTTVPGPTYREMLHPELLPAAVRNQALSGAGCSGDELDPINLFNITWRGPDRQVRHIALPKELTGVQANIIVLVGRNFPSGSHKVGPAYTTLMEGELAGEISPGVHTVIAPSTVNFGIGAAYVSHLKGYPATVIMPEGMSKERYARIRQYLSLIHISEPTRLGMISYAVFCLKKK